MLKNSIDIYLCLTKIIKVFFYLNSCVTDLFGT